MRSLIIILPLFILLCLGYICRRLKIFDTTAVATLNRFVYYIGLPALIVKSLHDIDLGVLLEWRLMVTNVVILVIIVGIMYLAIRTMRSKPHMAAAMILGSFIGNVAFIGLPLSEFAFGAEAVPYAAIIVAIHVIALFVFGIEVLEHYSAKKHKEYRIYRSPVIIAIAVGLILTKVPFPEVISRSISLLAATVTPIVLFSLGVFLVLESLKRDIFRKEALLLVLIKLLILPAIAWGFGTLVGMTGTPLKVTVLLAAMPIGILDFVLADNFHTESKFMADAVVITTLLSFITVPIILSLLL